MTGFPASELFAAAQTAGSRAPRGLGVVEFVLLAAAIGFLLYVLAGARRPGGVLLGVLLLALAAGSFVVLLDSSDSEKRPAAISTDVVDGTTRSNGSNETSDRAGGNGTAPIEAAPAEAGRGETNGRAGNSGTPGSHEALDERSAATPEGEPSKSRPAWLDEFDAPVVRDGVYYHPVSSGLYASREECQRALDRQIERAMWSVLDRFFSTGFQVGPPAAADKAFIHDKIVQETWLETDEKTAVGEMYQLHALLRVDPGVRAVLRDKMAAHYGQRQQQERLFGVGGVAAIVLALVAAIFGYLKIDTATKGYYSGRLKLALAVVVAALIAAGIGIIDELEHDTRLPPGLLEDYSQQSRI